MANFRIAYAPQLGSGAQTAFRDGDVADAKFREVGGAPGLIFPFEGNLYQIFRNRNGSALAEGDLLKPYFGNAARTGTASAGTADGFTSADTFTAGELVDSSVPSYVFLTAGTGVNQRRRIRSHTAGANAVIKIAIFDRSLNKASTAVADKWATNPDGTSVYSIVLPWESVKHAAAADECNAISLAAVTDGNWSIAQIAGFALLKCVGTTDALTAGGTVVPSATAGQAKGPTTAAETVAEARLSLGISFDAYTGAVVLRHILQKLRLTTFWPITA